MRSRKFSGKWLRKIRLEADYTQKELAARIGVSRETIVAIENEYPATINTISIYVIDRWWQVCHPGLSGDTRNDFVTYIKRFLRIP